MSLSEKWAHRLAANGVISQEDEALYSYGLRQGGILLRNVTTIICIGWIMGIIRERVLLE